MATKVLLFAFLAAAAIFLYQRFSGSGALEANMETGNRFLTSNQSREEVIQTSSGLQYEILLSGGGEERPAAADTVKVHYHGTLIDGSVFDSSVDRGEPISFGLNKVIKGWTEGLQLMAVGDKYRFFIPPNLAYGKRRAGSIGPGSTLIFDVELLAINE